MIKIKEKVPQERIMVDRVNVAILLLLAILVFVSLCAQFWSPLPFRSDWKSLRNEKGVFLVTPSMS